MSASQRIVVIDSQVAGVSGDMLLGALLDLGASPERVGAAFAAARDNLNGCTDLRLKVTEVTRHGLRGRKADVEYRETASSRSIEALRTAIVKTSQELGLSPRAQQLAANTVDTLFDAERKVHGEADDLHLHELSSADTVADIIGAVVSLEDLGLFANTTIYATPVAVGSGSIQFSHGTVPVPVPVALEILRARNFPFVSGPVAGELATPTGLALLVNLAQNVTGAYPPLKPVAIGYGAGTRELAGIANLLRVTVGEPVEASLAQDSIYVLETNVDDVPGEVIGYTVERLLREGARDCTVIPVYAKKNRPGQLIQVITDEANREKLARLLMMETGTLGVRCFPGQRYVLERETIPMAVTIEGTVHQVNVKVSRDRTGKIVQIKPEYEELKALAEQIDRPLREVSQLVQEAAQHALAGKD